ncbi:MAG TPA: diaminopimelate epimerase [Phycisphaerae bacterium]|nr:diaminopimelate epimerase [Phycisphaerae bacterium]HNU47171.1 diaminopimelate epimerase [Phycisphaerae bacterium]
MRFVKMHGLGNDYVYVDCFAQQVADPAQLARAMSQRHTGVGADGLILIKPSAVADLTMEVYNADGSRAQMCGNGIRCVAKYAVEHGLVTGPRVRIETDAGVRSAVCRAEPGRASSVRVDMGVPLLDPAAFPARVDVDRLVDYPLKAGGASCRVTCVSMGNPHAVWFVDDPDQVPLATVGPLIEHAAIFPERINVHVARAHGRDRVTVRTWERGSGITLACGTGACAACVAGVLTGRTGRTVIAGLPGGELLLEWADDQHVYMTGPAVEVFTGNWPE